MFWRGNTYKKMKLKRELKAVNKEISRSKRYGYHFGVLVLQVDNSIPRGLSKTLPGRPISCHVLESHLARDQSRLGPVLMSERKP